MPSILTLAFYFVLAVWKAQPARTADVNYQFNIVNGDIAPDGFNRNAVLVNGRFPGTLIQANKEDTLHLNVSVQLTNTAMRRSTSIHWHGLFQHKTASEDGPAMVNQCPIAPGHAYTYDIPLRGQAGTFWYHSHLSTQYFDGLRGVLVVYDNDDPHKALYDVDDASTVISLADWYHGLAPILQATYFSSNNGGGKEPVPDSGLINGHGRFKNGPTTTAPRSVVPVTKGKRYRFRVVNISGFAQFQFSIDGHRLTIIEADGISHQPLTVDSFNIYVGQRYSVVVEANQPVANYWIRAPLTVSGASDNKNLDAGNVFAVLHYDGAPNAEPTTQADSSAGGGGSANVTARALERRSGGSGGGGSGNSGKGGSGSSGGGSGKGGGGGGGGSGGGDDEGGGGGGGGSGGGEDEGGEDEGGENEGGEDEGGDDEGSSGGGGGGTLLQENNLKALNLPVPGGTAPADRVIDLDFTKTKDSAGRVEWSINGIQYKPPSLPTLMSIVAHNFTAESDFSSPEHTFVLNRDQVIELNIHGSLHGITHPFHLHGHAFHVIKSSDGGPANFVDPPVRDVIGVGGGGVTIRFRADNPGPWFLHCHIDWHLEAGLAVVFAEAPQDQRIGEDAQIIKDSWVDLCTIYNNLPADQQ